MVVPWVTAHVLDPSAAACAGVAPESSSLAAPPVFPHAYAAGDASADHEDGAALRLEPSVVPMTGAGAPRPSARQLWDAFSVEPGGLRARPQPEPEKYARNFTYEIVNGREETHEMTTRCHDGECTTLTRDTVPENDTVEPVALLPARCEAKASKLGIGSGRTCLIWDGLDDLASWLAGKAGGLLARPTRTSGGHGDLVDGTLRSLTYSNVNGKEEFLDEEMRCHAGRCTGLSRRVLPTELRAGDGQDAADEDGVPASALPIVDERAVRRVLTRPPMGPAAPAGPPAHSALAPAELEAPLPGRHSAGLSMPVEGRSAGGDLVAVA